MRITPAGVHGTTRGLPASSAPRFDVLLRRDRREHARRIDVLWQRQLHENAVHGRIRIQFSDACD
jgi:hypothetical protein